MNISQLSADTFTTPTFFHTPVRRHKRVWDWGLGRSGMGHCPQTLRSYLKKKEKHITQLRADTISPSIARTLCVDHSRNMKRHVES